MHILAAQRKSSRPVLSLMKSFKKSDSSRTFETSGDESCSSWDAAEKAAGREDPTSDDDFIKMIDKISLEVAEEFAKRVDHDGSESVSSSSDSSKIDANSIANSLLSLCRDVDGNIWDLELEDIFTADNDVSELDFDASENETTGVPEIAATQALPKIEETAKVKPAEIERYQFSVKFDKITVREYGIILGDNPACRCGPSVSIGWEYDEFLAIQLDDFESLREGNRRTKRGMLMDRSYRAKLLKRLGYAESDIIDAVRLNKKVHQARLQTLSKGIVGSKLANVSRKFQGFMPRRSNPSI